MTLNSNKNCSNYQKLSTFNKFTGRAGCEIGEIPALRTASSVEEPADEKAGKAEERPREKRCKTK